MNVDVIIQARSGSTRLPAKVLRPLAGEPMLSLIVRRVRRAESVRSVVVATSDLPDDDRVEALCASMEPPCPCFRGSEADVLDRYWRCVEWLGSDVVVRATADNPFVDPGVIDRAVGLFLADGGIDHLSYRAGLPLGVSAEVFSVSALERAWSEAVDPECREHVTPYLYRNPDIFRAVKAPVEGEDLGAFRLTVDTSEDFETVEGILTCFGGDPATASYLDAVRTLRDRPEFAYNSSIKQNVVAYAGESMGKKSKEAVLRGRDDLDRCVPHGS